MEQPRINYEHLNDIEVYNLVRRNLRYVNTLLYMYGDERLTLGEMRAYLEQQQSKWMEIVSHMPTNVEDFVANNLKK